MISERSSFVPFPFTDQSATKQRPVVVVSSSAYHRQRLDVIVMAVTSQVPPITSVGEVVVKDWQKAGLIKPSTIKPVIATLAQSLVIKSLGKLQPVDLQTLKQAITQILG